MSDLFYLLICYVSVANNASVTHSYSDGESRTNFVNKVSSNGS